MRKRNRNWTPSFYQRHVLLTLAQRGECTAGDWTAWYPMDTRSVYGVIMRLANRALVDVAGFDGRARTYKLTADGWAIVETLTPEEEDES